MKNYIAMLAAIIAILALALCGCARFTTTQTDQSYEKGQPTRAITTRAATWTFFDSSSQLANFKASQTDKTQTASVGSLSQSATSTNVVEGLKYVSDIAKTLSGH